MEKMAQVDGEGVTSSTVASSGSTPSRLIRLPEVMKRVGLSRSAVYKRMGEGRFPHSRSLGPKCAVWVEAEIDAWISAVSNCAESSSR